MGNVVYFIIYMGIGNFDKYIIVVMNIVGIVFIGIGLVEFIDFIDKDMVSCLGIGIVY